MKRYAVIVALVFGLAFAAQFLAAGANVFAMDWSMWQLCINAGIVAVVAWFVAYATDLKKEIVQLRAEQTTLIKHMADDYKD
jgi:hypothetical protein